MTFRIGVHFVIYIVYNENNNLATKFIDIVGNYYDNFNTGEQTKIGNELFKVCKAFVLRKDVQNYPRLWRLSEPFWLSGLSHGLCQ